MMMEDQVYGSMVASSVEAPAKTFPGQGGERVSAAHRKRWGDRTFRFSLASFRPGANLSLRRFSMTEASLLFSMAFVVAKGMGVIRQLLFNFLFGTGPQATAYIAAFNLPDTIFSLIAGGALSSALIPVFISYEQREGTKETWRLISLVFNILLVILTASILLAECLTPQFVDHLLVPGLPPAQKALTTILTRIMLLNSLILGLGTVVTAILNSKRQFFLPALSIAIYEFGMIGGLLLTLAIPPLGIYGPTFGLVVSAISQVAIQLPALLKQKMQYSFIWDLKHPGLRDIMNLLGPNVLAVGIGTLTSVLDIMFASYFPDKASIAALNNAALFYGVPSVFLAQAVGQALLPQITLQREQGHYLRMSLTIVKVVGGAVLLSILAAFGLYVLGQPVIRLLFQHGAFTAHSTALTYMALTGYAIAVPGSIANALLELCFYAIKDAKTPLFAKIVIVIAHVGLLIFLLKIFAGQDTILSVPLTTAITGTIGAIFLALILFLRLRAEIKTDKGFRRLQMRHLRAEKLRVQMRSGSGR
jgi:putative peptidoglycan lipid II flippase